MVREQGYFVPKAAQSLDIASNMLCRWKEHIESQLESKVLPEDERSELKQLRKEMKVLLNEVKFYFIRDESVHFPATVIYRVMQIGTSAYYARKRRPTELISAETLHLYRRMKALFEQSHDSLGSREMKNKLREEGFTIVRQKTRKLMKNLKLKVKQRIAYKVTTKRNDRDKVADNLLNQNFNPVTENKVWVGDITYLKTAEGWLYLAIVIDLYLRHIVGWYVSNRMTTALIFKAMMMAYNLREPPKDLVFHSDRVHQQAVP